MDCFVRSRSLARLSFAHSTHTSRCRLVVSNSNLTDRSVWRAIRSIGIFEIGYDLLRFDRLAVTGAQHTGLVIVAVVVAAGNVVVVVAVVVATLTPIATPCGRLSVRSSVRRACVRVRIRVRRSEFACLSRCFDSFLCEAARARSAQARQALSCRRHNSLPYRIVSLHTASTCSEQAEQPYIYDQAAANLLHNRCVSRYLTHLLSVDDEAHLHLCAYLSGSANTAVADWSRTVVRQFAQQANKFSSAATTTKVPARQICT